MIALSYVYRNLDTGAGYVGRAPRGNFTLVARPGQIVDDGVVEALGSHRRAKHEAN